MKIQRVLPIAPCSISQRRKSTYYRSASSGIDTFQRVTRTYSTAVDRIRTSSEIGTGDRHCSVIYLWSQPIREPGVIPTSKFTRRAVRCEFCDTRNRFGETVPVILGDIGPLFDYKGRPRSNPDRKNLFLDKWEWVGEFREDAKCRVDHHPTSGTCDADQFF